MKILDGKVVAENIKIYIKQQVEQLIATGKKQPHLAAILVGNDGGSITYVGHKVKACEQVGFASTLLHFDENITENFLLQQVEKLNADENIDGFIVQLPLPQHIRPEKVLLAIDPEKDVDGFHPFNVGRLALGLPTFVSATPLGIIKLLEHYQIETTGKDVVVIGRSNIVGRPVSILLGSQSNTGNATVTLCHSKTRNLKEKTLQADIIVAALGKPEFLTADMVKEGAVVVDVGTTRVPDPYKKSGFSLKGDVKFDEVAPKCSYITPVPGGVGPMTVVSLLLNTLLATQKKYATDDCTAF